MLVFINIISQLEGIEDVTLLRKALFDATDVVINSGYTKPLTSAEVSDRKEITETVSLHCTLLQSLAEMDQLKRGLNVLGVANYMKDYPLFFTSYFTSQDSQKLSAGIIISFSC